MYDRRTIEIKPPFSLIFHSQRGNIPVRVSRMSLHRCMDVIFLLNTNKKHSEDDEPNKGQEKFTISFIYFCTVCVRRFLWINYNKILHVYMYVMNQNRSFLIKIIIFFFVFCRHRQQWRQIMEGSTSILERKVASFWHDLPWQSQGTNGDPYYG